SGMMGGYPGSVNVYKYVRDSDIDAHLRRSDMIGDIAELRGEPVTLQLRQENFTQKPHDVYAVIWSAAGGFGDPLERDPEKVRDDVVENRSVSAAAAREIYGVVLDSDSQLDREGTQRLRSQYRQRRRGDKSVRRLSGEVISEVTENLTLRREADGKRLCCAKCAADLGPIADNYKAHCVAHAANIETANPNIGDHRRYIDDVPVFRQFFCPGCGALIENEITRADEPVLRDIELRA